MKDTDVPALFPIPFGSAAAVGDILYPTPQSSQPAGSGRASLSDGFQHINFVPIAAGGIPPFGPDVNGILFWTSSWDRWGQSGGPVKWSSTHSSDIGGYPRGAIVASAVTNGLVWLSTVNDNTTNPDANPPGAGWTALLVLRGQQYYSAAGSNPLVVPAGVTRMYADGCGAGAGGGGTWTTGDLSSGGGGGERRSGWLSVVPGETLTVVNGAGGAPGSNGANGIDGGNTTITGSVSGLIYRANGGGHGIGSFTNGIILTPGTPGTGGLGGQRVIPGSAGGIGFFFNPGGTVLTGLAFGGASWATASPTGFSVAVGAAATVNGNPGIFPGAGGTGSAHNTSTGGTGHDGELLLSWGNYG